ncbi:hypothetical protein BP6252_10793 [Coleophoma cylindrospora]|uniref:BD-FAE-like domain-containing protein n=1 Tax=Coleophoma cylindrospora TaxID=1849047 RepID=A0A3D8QNI6_9HELO|nr:hypothetical protein BP6252_10793 [Coleophoma cylindrospora]
MSDRDALNAAIEKYGAFVGLPENDIMIDLATKIHKAENNDFSTSVKVVKALKYGPDERNRIDVYSPANATPSSKLPVALYFHGGGMVSGDNDINPVMYGNVGYYFASNSCVCILSTYRLLPTARHPDGANDVTSAMKWAIENCAAYGGDATRITVMGHSAGGSQLGTALWGGYLRDAGIQEKFACYVFLSAGLWYDVLNPPTSINMSNYHGTTDIEKIRREDPLSTFRRADKETMASWGKMWFFLSEFEFKEIVEGTVGCMEAYRKTMDKFLLMECIERENHVSYMYSLGTKGNRVGPRLLELVTESFK